MKRIMIAGSAGFVIGVTTAYAASCYLVWRLVSDIENYLIARIEEEDKTDKEFAQHETGCD